MGKLKNYDCHKQKYYVPQTKPKWSVLNLKQASKKIDKEKSAAKKQTLGKKAKVALKLANRKGGRGLRNPANPDFQKNLQKVRPLFERAEVARISPPPRARFPPTPPIFRDITYPAPARGDADRVSPSPPPRARSPAPTPPRPRPAGQEPEEGEAFRPSQRPSQLSPRPRSPPPTALAPPREPQSGTEHPPSAPDATTMAPSTSSAATPAGRGKKRAAAVASSDAADPAAERFARRVALHLRDAAAAHDEPWDAASLRAGFADAVANLPDGALKQRLSADVDGFAARVVEKTTRPTADDEPAAGEFGGVDDDAFHAARRAPRRDFDAMTLAELAEETSARLVRASFDFPSWIGDTPEERDELETAREVNLEMIADAAEATAKSYAGVGKKTNATEEERRVVGEVLCRALAYAALRRHGRDEHGRGAPGRARTEAAAARLVMARQMFRGATAKADRDDTDARRDAAVACGDSRVALIRALAKEVPDDVDARGIAQGAQEGAQEGAQGKKKGRKLVVGGFGARDLPLFEAALGLGGFDATFEAEVRPVRAANSRPPRFRFFRFVFLFLPLSSAPSLRTRRPRVA